MIKAVNFHHYGSAEALTAEFGDRWVYIGRGGKGMPHSPLHNPFEAGSTADPIAEFKKHLFQQMQDRHTAVARELTRVAFMRNPVLVCFCKPKPCHGDAIVSAVRYYWPIEARIRHRTRCSSIKSAVWAEIVDRRNTAVVQGDASAKPMPPVEGVPSMDTIRAVASLVGRWSR